MADERISDRIEAARRQRARFFDPFTGKLHVHVGGGSDVPPPTPPPAPTPPPTPAPSTPPPTLTQADVDKATKAAATKAEREAQERFEAWLKERKDEADRAAMDDVTRAKAEAEEARAEADRVRAEAAQERLHARIERKLGAAGAPESGIADLVPGVKVTPDASDEDLDTAIGALKERLPGAFTATSTPAPNVAPATPPPVRSTGTGIDPARERARQRHGYKPAPAA